MLTPHPMISPIPLLLLHTWYVPMIFLSSFYYYYLILILCSSFFFYRIYYIFFHRFMISVFVFPLTLIHLLGLSYLTPLQRCSNISFTLMLLQLLPSSNASTPLSLFTLPFFISPQFPFFMHMHYEMLLFYHYTTSLASHHYQFMTSVHCFLLFILHTSPYSREYVFQLLTIMF